MTLNFYFTLSKIYFGAPANIGNTNRLSVGKINQCKVVALQMLSNFTIVK